MQVSKGIATSVEIDYEEMYALGISKRDIVIKLSKIWSLTIPEVVEIINKYEAAEAEDNLGEIV